MSPPRPSRRGLPLVFFVAVVLLRLPVLLAQLDTRYAFEIFSGTVATALLDGIDLDVSTLTVIPHVRGGALFGLLLVPFYALLGPTTLAMKLLPLLWHATTVALVVSLCGRFFGRSAGVTTGLLLLLAPPLLQKLSVTGFASHMESSLPAMAAFALFVSLTRTGAESQRTAWRWLALGLVTGFSAFFHLQALLACLMLLGLLLVQQPRLLLRGVVPVVIGVLVGMAPRLLFESDDKGLVAFVLGSGRADEVRASDTGAGWSHYGTWGKAKALLTSGPGPVLEFGDAASWWVPVLAHVSGVGMLLGGALALWRERRGLAAWLARLAFRRTDVSPSPLVFLPLHVLVVLALLAVSGMALNFWAAGSGMEGRRLAPAVFSLLVLAGIGLARGPDGRRPPLAWLVLLALVVAGAAGTAIVARSTPASRLPARGECYEWFLRQLQHHAARDQAVLLDELQRIDRGDPRFLTMRFNLALGIPPKAPFADNLRRALRPARPVVRLMRLTALGRSACQSRETLLALPGVGALAELSPDERTTVMHGAGLHLSTLILRRAQVDPFVLRLVREFPRPDGEALLEGYGFFQGFGQTHYNEFHRQRLVELEALPVAARRAFLRGFGWGFRQRYLEPPGELPEGLAELDWMPSEGREAFLDGLLGRHLPPEARLLAAVRDG